MNNIEYKISVVITFYNNEKTIENIMLDIQAQTLKETQIICVDCGSWDNTHNFLIEHANNNKNVIVLRQKSSNINVANKFGVMFASSKQVYFVNNKESLSDEKFFESIYNNKNYEELIYNNVDITNKKLLIRQVVGGTCSQLRAFWTGYQQAKKYNRELILDISDYYNGFKFTYTLDFFKIDCDKLIYMHKNEKALSKECVSQQYIDKYKPVLINTTSLSIDDMDIALANVNESKIVHLMGECSQSYEDMDKLNEFCVPKNETIYIEKFKEEIKDKISIGVHVRLTDFIQLGWNDLSQNDYYLAAMNYFEEKFENPYFYIFSDDIHSVKEKFGYKENYKYIKLLGGFDVDIEEIYCMSLCTHLITTKKSGIRTYSNLINYNKDATVLYLSEEEDNEFPNEINFTSKMVEKYFNNNTNSDSLNILERIETIKNYIDKKDFDIAQNLLTKILFDYYGVTKNIEIELFSIMIKISIENKKILFAENLLQKFFQEYTSLEALNYMTTVKLMNRKELEAIVYASSVCIADEKQKIITTEKFKNSDNYDLAKQVCETERKHFIIHAITKARAFILHEIALAVWLQRLGHEVSVITKFSGEVGVSESNIENFVKISIDNVIILNSLFNFNVKIYNYHESNGISTLSNLTDTLVKNSNIKPVIISKLPNIFKNNYPKIYWDTSNYDLSDNLMLESNTSNLEGNLQKFEMILAGQSNAVITSCKQKFKDYLKILPKNNVFYTPTYRSLIDDFTSENIYIPENIISNDEFLLFVFKIIEISKTL